MLNTLLWIVSLVLFAALAILIVVPLIWRTGKWFVRAWDFPRLQLASLTILPAIPLLVLVVRDSHAAVAWVLLALLLALALSGVVQLLPFTRLWRREVADLESPQDAPTLSILIANICYESEQHGAVARKILEGDPDLLLLIEINDTWRDALSELRERFPHRLEAIAGDGLGLALWSKPELHDGRIEHIVSERRPSIFAGVELGDGRRMRFVGLHPTPPGLEDETGEDRRDSRVRDGELVMLARHISDDPHQNWVVAGDFNDVAWSHTTRLFKRLSGLNDPRVGRTLLNTYHAQYSLLRYPVDHLFVAPGFRVGGLKRVRLPGSDHFGVLGRLRLEPQAERKPAESEADGEDQQEASEAVEEGIEDAQERALATSHLGIRAV